MKLADLYIQDLRRIGVEMTPEFIEVASLVERLRERDYESYVAVLEVTNDPDEWSVYWETGGYENGYDWGAYSNARVDELFGLARRELDAQSAPATMPRSSRSCTTNSRSRSFWDYRLLWAFSNRMRGVNFAAAGVFLFFPGTADWWMAKEPMPLPAASAGS